MNYNRHRFSPQIMAHAVWLYRRFNLSLREVEEVLLVRGIDVSHETVRRWVIKFGPVVARCMRRRQGHPSDVWHLDEVVVKISGRKFWLWRAVDQHGMVLDEILQPNRDKLAAKRLLRRLIKRPDFIPKRIITDKLRSYGAANREIAPGLDHWSHKGLNNRFAGFGRVSLDGDPNAGPRRIYERARSRECFRKCIPFCKVYRRRAWCMMSQRTDAACVLNANI